MQTIRPAGFNERRCIARDSLTLYGLIVTIGVYSSTSRDEQILSKGDIFKALKDCIARQPVLSTIVQDSHTEQPQLARATSIDLNNHVQILESAGAHEHESFLQSFLERIHNEPLSNYETRPQWRVYVSPKQPSSPKTVQCFRVAFASSHALCDGASGLIFHRAFLEALRTESLPFSSDPLYEPPKEPKLLLPLEQLANFTVSWSFLLGPLLAEYLPHWMTSMLGFRPEEKDSGDVDRAWTGSATRPERASPTELPPTAVECVAVPPKMLEKVLGECRKHDARLTGLLSHLATRSLARALLSQGESYGKFVVDTALDLRRSLPQGQGQMGNLVSAYAETIHAGPKQLDRVKVLTSEDWTAIARSTEKLNIASRTLADQPIALLKYLTGYRDWTLKNASTPAKGAFGMSNLGNFDPVRDPYSAWSIDEMLFSQSADCTNAPLNVNVASAKDGSLWIVLSWWPGMLGVQDERKLAKETGVDILRQLKAVASVSV